MTDSYHMTPDNIYDNYDSDAPPNVVQPLNPPAFTGSLKITATGCPSSPLIKESI